jgi:FkbM family methyltransferase
MIFNLHQITDHYQINIGGAIHVGAFVGEELDAYRSLGLTNTIMFEPQKTLYEIVKAKCIGDESVHNVALGSHSHTTEMYISYTEGGVSNGSGASSSLYRPKKHLTEHPQVKFNSKEEVRVECLDDFLVDNNIDVSGYNFLNIDVQGYELEVLAGGIKLLPQIDMAIVEVNRDEVYEGCPMVEEIDQLMNVYGLQRAHTFWQSESWGDALYVRV